MVSVMTDFEIHRNDPAVSADLSFLGIESAEKATVSEGNIADKIFDGGNEDSASEKAGMECLRKMSLEEVRVPEDVSGGALRVSEGDCRDISVRVEETRVSEINSREGEIKMEARVSEANASEQPLGDINDSFIDQTSVSFGEMKRELVEERRVSGLSSSCSVFDEVSSVGSPELTVFGIEKHSSSCYGFEPGDMVWGKVKSHPWWPGHIFNEAFATTAVRRTKREGHVLVAFFGDSSYGWFDPSELIPFEPHYAEKSQQTNSRNFMKAVEEAVDELSRRSALGLACRCRNPFNFRPTTVQGYFAVDVDGYEPGGVYSAKQIKSSRGSFEPVEVLSFLDQLALMPCENETMSINQIKNVASIRAYRRVVYEEFDETYAQAFGQQPVRPSRNAFGALEQPNKAPPRAPLSGPLVIAEALGEKKNFKLAKAKDQTKKDKYLLKRRDEPNEQRVMKPESNHIGQVHVNVMPLSAFNVAAVNFPVQVGGYVMQKRAPSTEEKHPVPAKQDTGETMSRGGGASTGEGTGGKDESVKSTPLANNFSSAEAPKNVNRLDLTTETETALDSQTSKSPLHDPVPAVGAISEDQKGQPELMSKETAVLKDLADRNKAAESAISMGTNTDVSNGIKPKLKISVAVTFDQDPVMGAGGSSTVSESVGKASFPGDARLPSKAERASTDGMHVEASAQKRPSEDLNAEKIVMGEKKKRKDSGVEPDLELVKKHLKVMKDGSPSSISAGKSIGITVSNLEHPRSVFQSKGHSIHLSKLDFGNIDLELPDLVDDLLGIALDPFHGVERNSPDIVLQAFLKFRSLVYQKSLVLPTASEPDVSATKSTMSKTQQESGVGNSVVPSNREGRERPATKSVKTASRPEDPAKIARKRGPSDRQEEMLDKKKKKISDLKALASQKKAAGLKTPDGQKGDRKEINAVTPTKPIRPGSLMKPEPPNPPRPEQPALLVMKFPPRTTLPSAPQLKAKFARFGPLDLSGIRVFWKSSTCRVVFRHKTHAQEAYSYARKYNPFGQGVNYHMRELEVTAPELPETSKQRVQDSSRAAAHFKSSNSDHTTDHRPIMHQQRQLAVQLKSCLKKPSSDDAGSSVNGMKESPRVKFMLGGAESSKGEPLMMGGSNNGSSADGSSFSLALDFNSKNVKSTSVLPPSQPSPFLPIPSPRFPPDEYENHGVCHFDNAIHQHSHFSELERRNNAADITHQMLSLLMRCNDIVTNVKSTLGYVPYHPL